MKRFFLVMAAAVGLASAQNAILNGVANQSATVTFEVHLPVALCTAAATSTLLWNIPPSGATAATASGCSGTNVNDAAGAFANSGTPSLQYSFLLPQTLTGTGDVYITYNTTTASGTFTVALDAVCTATSSSATDNPSWTAGNFFAPGSATASATINQLGTVSAAGLSWPSGCSAGTRLHLRLIRTDTAGTATSVNLFEVTIVGLRTI